MAGTRPPAPDPIGKDYRQNIKMMQFSIKLAVLIIIGIAFLTNAGAQSVNREFSVQAGAAVEIINFYGRVDAIAEGSKSDDVEETAGRLKELTLSMSANSTVSFEESEIKIDKSPSGIKIEVVPSDAKKRIDISVTLPPQMKIKIETREGEVRVSGNLESAEVLTDTGTIAADVPTNNLKYAFHWSASRPRFMSDIELEKVKEKSGGKFEIKGKYTDAETPGSGDAKSERRGDAEVGTESPASAGGLTAEPNNGSEPPALAGGMTTAPKNGSLPVSSGVKATVIERVEYKKTKTKSQKPKSISLNFTTARGIILLNIPPNEVSSDLRERPLTVAAKAIIRSGDSLLMEAIRRAAPKYFGDYTKTLPPFKREPSFAERSGVEEIPTASIKTASVRVTDLNNRAIAGLQSKDFDITENNFSREILSVKPVTAPFNLVLLLDVSGSVDNYVNFIRKAARNFVDTVDARDRISIVTFNEDVKLISKFTTDKTKLSENLDTFDAGGGTAFYDALAYTLAETLRPLKGERTAIVILTDGDDNRSFLPFDSMLASIQESGALIYPLYVPSALIAASAASDSNAPIDSLRGRYMTLTSKAEGEGDRLAKVSGGVYYPITQLSQIQAAYNDIATQLRSGYVVTFRSQIAGNGASPRLKIRTKKDNAFVSVVSVVGGQ